MSPDSDDRALRALMAGVDDDRSVSALDRKYRSRFELIAAKDGIPRADCADVAQNALITAVGQIRRGLFRGESTLGTWLVTILKGKIADYRRSHRHVRTEGTYGSLDRPAHAGDAADAISQPATQELRLVVRDALELLPPEHRLILLLNQRDGFTIEQIAIYLHRSGGRFGALLAEAKRMLRIHLRSSETSAPVKRLEE